MLGSDIKETMILTRQLTSALNLRDFDNAKQACNLRTRNVFLYGMIALKWIEFVAEERTVCFLYSQT